jgi:hypothetical protein
MVVISSANSGEEIGMPNGILISQRHSGLFRRLCGCQSEFCTNFVWVPLKYARCVAMDFGFHYADSAPEVDLFGGWIRRFTSS